MNTMLDAFIKDNVLPHRDHDCLGPEFIEWLTEYGTKDHDIALGILDRMATKYPDLFDPITDTGEVV